MEETQFGVFYANAVIKQEFIPEECTELDEGVLLSEEFVQEQLQCEQSVDKVFYTTLLIVIC